MQNHSSNPFFNGAPAPASYTVAAANQHLRKVFGLMALAVCITAGIAFLMPLIAPVGSNLFATLFLTPFKWVLMLAPLGFVIALGAGIHRMSVGVATAVFLAYAAVVGVSISTIFFRFETQSIVGAFLVSGGLFAGLAVFGAVTKIDLTKIGNILMVALVVLVIASVVNWFLMDNGLSVLISAVGIVVFAGLTAYDVQNIVRYGAAAEAGESKAKMAILGALNLYLDFLNLFMFILRLFGGRK